MLRLLLIILVVGVVIGILRRIIRGSLEHETESAQIPTTPMVSCHFCQLHIIKKDALSLKGKYYCCIEHQEKSGPGKCQ